MWLSRRRYCRHRGPLSHTHSHKISEIGYMHQEVCVCVCVCARARAFLRRKVRKIDTSRIGVKLSTRFSYSFVCIKFLHSPFLPFLTITPSLLHSSLYLSSPSLLPFAPSLPSFHSFLPSPQIPTLISSSMWRTRLCKLTASSSSHALPSFLRDTP